MSDIFTGVSDKVPDRKINDNDYTFKDYWTKLFPFFFVLVLKNPINLFCILIFVICIIETPYKTPY